MLRDPLRKVIDKFKVIPVLMALIAVFLVFVSFNYLKSGLNPAKLSRQTGNLSFESDNDWDNDGLTNREESFWNTDPNKPDTDGDGYLDGEEVASVHDPLIPAPNDFLPTKDNLTMKMSQLTLAGLAEGSLKSDNPNYETALNGLADAIANDAITSLTTDTSKINITVTASDKSFQQTYIEKLSPIYEELLKVFIEQMLALEKNLNDIGAFGMTYGGVSKSFSGSSSRYEDIFNNLVKINVPENWKEDHLGIIKLTGELSQASQAVVSGINDPIKAAAGLNKIVLLWKVIPQITESYSEKIRANELKTDQTIFK